MSWHILLIKLHFQQQHANLDVYGHWQETLEISYLGIFKTKT